MLLPRLTLQKKKEVNDTPTLLTTEEIAQAALSPSSGKSGKVASKVQALIESGVSDIESVVSAVKSDYPRVSGKVIRAIFDRLSSQGGERGAIRVPQWANNLADVVRAAGVDARNFASHVRGIAPDISKSFAESFSAHGKALLDAIKHNPSGIANALWKPFNSLFASLHKHLPTLVDENGNVQILNNIFNRLNRLFDEHPDWIDLRPDVRSMKIRG